MHEHEPAAHDNTRQNRSDPDGKAAAEPNPQESAPGEEGEHQPRLEPRIYVASLLDHNAGILHGRWLEAAVEPAELQHGISEMLAASPTAAESRLAAEDWAIHDHEDFGTLYIGEYENVEWVTAVAKGIAEHGPAFAVWAAHLGAEHDDLDAFEQCYLGEWESAEAYAGAFLDDLGASEAIAKLDDWLQAYVDVDVAGFARDLQLGGDITVIRKPDGGVWVFEGR